jgi:hypothetical protein
MRRPISMAKADASKATAKTVIDGVDWINQRVLIIWLESDRVRTE